MLKYETVLVPPVGEPNRVKSECTIADVIRTVISDDLDAERLIRFGVADYQSLLVAYGIDGVYGFQLVDYDHNEMEIVLGRQVLNAALSPEESDFLREDLARQARASYEDLF